MKAVFFSFLFLISSPLFAAQELLPLPTGTPSLSPVPEQTAVEKSIAEQLQDVERSIEKAQAVLAYMQSAETANGLAAAGLPSTVQSELVVAASNALRNFQRDAENLRTLERVKKNAEARQALTEVDNSPNYNSETDISIVQDRLNSTQQAWESATKELKMLEESTQAALSLFPKLEQTLRQFPKNPTPADNWQLTLTKLQRKEAESRILANVVRKKVLTLRITALEEDAAVDKKLLQAEATAIQPGQRAEAMTRLEKERLQINRQLQEANKRNQNTQIALDKARENYLKNRNTTGNGDTAIIRQQYELAQMEAETAEGIIETSRLYLQILDTETAHWKYIAKLGDRISTEEIQKGHAALNHQLQLIHKWKPQLEQEIRSKQITLESLMRRLTEGKLPDIENNFLNKKIKLLKEQMGFQQRLFWRVETLNWRLLDWLKQLKKDTPSFSIQRSLKEMGTRLYSTLWGVIHYEVFSFKETSVIAGNKVIVAEHSVTIARIVSALIFFLLGYFFLAKLAQFLIRSAQVRFQLPVARITLLEKILLYLMTVTLVLCTLNWARIPLTIFAYLGGALAIGVGFGAQNLINNFISGIILLFERQINVGDIVEVDGNIGEVTTLGNRCSRMRRADGVEMLVPNSHLLEKNVVNWTLSDLDHRFQFTFTVAYGSALEKVAKLVQQAFTETPHILSHPLPCIFFEEFGKDGLIFGVYFWVKLYKGIDARQIGSNLRTRIYQLFQNEGIHMPFPQHDLHWESPLRIQLEHSSSDS